MQSIADFRKYVKILEEDSKGSHRPGFILNLKVVKWIFQILYTNLKVSANKISFTPTFSDVEASIVEVKRKSNSILIVMIGLHNDQKCCPRRPKTGLHSA